jgi:hypothetical protein
MPQYLTVTRGERQFFVEKPKKNKHFGKAQAMQVIDEEEKLLTEYNITIQPPRTVVDQNRNAVIKADVPPKALEALGSLAQCIANQRFGGISLPFFELGDFVTAVSSADPLGHYREDHPKLGLPALWLFVLAREEE